MLIDWLCFTKNLAIIVDRLFLQSKLDFLDWLCFAKPFPRDGLALLCKANLLL
jgi:hypothetical protein